MMLLAFDNSAAAVYVLRPCAGRVSVEYYGQHGTEELDGTFHDNVQAINAANRAAGRLLFFWPIAPVPHTERWPYLTHLLK